MLLCSPFLFLIIDFCHRNKLNQKQITKKMMIIALLTDFGNRDWFVGTMKGVILRINPNVEIVDISHDISPQNVHEAGFVLWNAYKYFPPKTIFVCVVDPRVGSERKIIAVETREYIFIAPDNGLLDFVLSEVGVLKAVYVENKNYFLEKVSSTFHGRDIFAPVSAYISRGVDISELGSEFNIKKPEKMFIEIQGEGSYKGKVIYIDRFGNLITNLRASGEINGEVKFKGTTISKISRTYSDVGISEVVALVDSSGLIEIGIRNGNAREFFKASYGDEVLVRVKKINIR